MVFRRRARSGPNNLLLRCTQCIPQDLLRQLVERDGRKYRVVVRHDDPVLAGQVFAQALDVHYAAASASVTRSTRQQKAFDVVFRRGPDRIARGITPKDYTKITKCPARTAGRDIAGLVEMGAITRVPGTATRNACYAITLPRQSQDAGCSEPSDWAQALFQSTDTDGRLYPANPSIRYDGPIVAADGWYAIQRVASQTFVAHSVQALDDSPQVGAVVSIHHGHIIAPERQETRGMNKKRKPTP